MILENFNISDNSIWYHGTNNSLSKIKINPPSLTFPFFITNDLEYAKDYSMFIDYEFGIAEFDKNSKLICLTLNSNDLNIIDLHSNDIESLNLNSDFKKLLYANNQLFDIASNIITMFNLVKKHCNSNNKQHISIQDINRIDFMQTIKNINSFNKWKIDSNDNISMQNSDRSTYTKLDDVYELFDWFRAKFDIGVFETIDQIDDRKEKRKLVYQFYEPLMKEIHQHGYNAFMNKEKTGNVICIGIIDLECINELSKKLYTFNDDIFKNI